MKKNDFSLLYFIYFYAIIIIIKIRFIKKMESDIISSLDNIIKIKPLHSTNSVNSLYLSDSENNTSFSEEAEETISFECYNKKKNINETHTFSLNDWNNYIQTVDSIHHIECLTCNRIITKEEYVKNGTFIYKTGNKVIERVNYINGKMDGLYERFYLNGIHYECTNYKDGLLHGTCEFWNDISGKKMKSMVFENGKLHGPYKSWDQSGKLVEDFYFNQGIRSDIMIKIPSKNLVDCSNKKDHDIKYVIPVNNIQENKDESIFDLSNKKKKKDKKNKKEKKDKDKNYSDSESDSDLDMEKL